MKPIKRAICLLLAVAAALQLFGCQTPQTEKHETEQAAHPPQARQAQAGDGPESLFTYDDANALA
ncbi:MAG TPA: hypothetical protein VN366_02710 [Feifaniaceae bacterium]|nr:hypothetical protein [Feifaniaceae bacterium]